ncbi:MAG: hypothetical protein LUQ50_12665 [Methanospirillum sp.]|uniref:hypothetical protein n=1 Tax=Methanospirillum sp. TaxID=45200 RepID=UPI00236D4AF2|nr:hypothetical protein [Methanospirillum sp.]MDD1729908.1 hypothetical protein [Methanospirillum sp.]
MQIRPLCFLMLFTLIVVPGISSAALLDEHTTDEWREILAIPENTTMLTGLQITLSISPDQYYLPQDSEVNLTGSITSIFGPIKNVPIVLARGNNTAPTPYLNLTSDENGDFRVTDSASTTGVIRYQAWFDGSDLKEKNITRSYEKEVRATPHTVNQSDISSGDAIASLVDPESPDNTGNLHTNASSLTLEVTPETYVSGQNVTLSGMITGNGNHPVPYTPVSIEKAEDENGYVVIGDTVATDTSGRYMASYHLTGPSSSEFRAVSSDGQGSPLFSDQVRSTFENTDDFSPPARERTGKRKIDADINAVIIRPGENITVSGWFSDGNGDGIGAGRLYLYWYNFADRIWDRYENCSEAITNDDGYYAFNVSGPNMTGISYMAVISKKEQTGKPLFSQILPLTVRGPVDINASQLSAILTVRSEPEEIQVHEKATITFTLSDPDGNPLAGEPVKMYFSEDGFTWYMNGKENVTTRTDGTVAMVDIPTRPGFHYYRGTYDGSDVFMGADSGILALVITGSEDQKVTNETEAIDQVSS